MGHDGGVAQRVADGHVAIERHDHEHGVSDAYMEVSTEGLDDALIIGHEALRHGDKHVTQDPRDDGGGPEHIVNTHVAEQQVHGLVQARLHADQNHQADVGHHDEDVDEEDEDEGRDGGLRRDLQPLHN